MIRSTADCFFVDLAIVGKRIKQDETHLRTDRGVSGLVIPKTSEHLVELKFFYLENNFLKSTMPPN